MPAKKYKTVTTINGRKVSKHDARISVFDNSLLYAEGLFETLLAVGENLIFLEEHLDRLYRGSDITGIQIPVARDRLRAWMKKTVVAHPSKIKKLRLTVTAGEAARWVGSPGRQQVILSASPHSMAEKPFRLHVSSFKVDQHSVFRQIKTISYAIHAAALKAAHEAGCDDAILLNEKNQVAEVTSANIFLVKHEKIYTPPLTAGCLEGTTRGHVIKEAARLGYEVSEKNFKLSDLAGADEVFISSSLKLVAAVSSVKTDTKTFRMKTGPITRHLRHHYFVKSGLIRG